MSYEDDLKNPLWQENRLRIFERDNWTCQSCGAGKNDGIPFHVHHLKYFSGLKPWEYEHYYLITYCEKCHETEHLIGGQVRQELFDIVASYNLPIKPLAQLCILTERFHPFGILLRNFLNECMIQYLKTKQLKAA